MRFDAVPHELLARCQAGELHAFEQLCEAIQQDLFIVLMSMLRNTEDAADAQQECLVRLFRHLGKLQDLSKFPGWLMRMIVNQCNTQRKAATIHPFSPLEELLEVPEDRLVAHSAQPASPRSAASAKELDVHVNAAMATLPEKQRAAIVLYEIEQLSIREISEILECSEGAIKFNLHEARKKLQKLLEPLLRNEPSRETVP